jgi:pyroglutamyl-peptidase
MKDLLISGFEPFGEDKSNPSWEAVKLLPPEISGYKVNKICLPVTFGKAANMLISRAEEISAKVIICVGLAGGRDSITPELVAINMRNAAIPDNEVNLPKDELIHLDGKTAYFSTIPVRKIEKAINEAQIPAKLSYSAGAYVCNDTFYNALSHFEGTDTLVGFIHVPYSKAENKEPSFEISEIARALAVAIENMD